MTVSHPGIRLRVAAAGLAVALATAAGASGASPALPRTLADLDRGRDVTILVAGDSLVAGVQPRVDGGLDPDAAGGPASWVGHFALLLARRYPDARVVLVRRSPEINSDGSATCAVTAPAERVLQAPATPRQTITVIRDGVGGNNVHRLLARWEAGDRARFPAGDRPPVAWTPTAVIVALGANDSLSAGAALDCYPKRHAVPELGTVDLRRRGESTAAFRKALAALRARLARLVPAPEVAFATAPGLFGPAATASYANAMREAARRSGTGLVDLEHAMRTAAPAPGTQPRDVATACAAHPWYRGTDCLHPNAAGAAGLGAAAFAAAFGT